MILYRPVGLQELTLIYNSGMKAFPTRLPKQPIFYPVLQLEYARKTASGWNTKKGESAGYVTQFKMEDEYIGQFEIHTVGKSQYQELWVPAEEMEEFNKHILGHIKVVEAHFGDKFEGLVPDQFGLKGKNAVDQFTWLANTYVYKRMDFYLEIKRNHKAIFLNYPFWQTYDSKNPGLKEKTLQAIKEAWFSSFPKTPLPNPVPRDTPPLESTNTQAPAQNLSKPVREEITPTKKSNSHPLIIEDIAPVQQTRPRAEDWADSDDEDDMLEEQTDADVEDFVDPDDEDIATVKQTVSRRQGWVNPIREEIPSVEQSDEDEDLADLLDEEDTSESSSSANPVRAEISRAEQTDEDEEDLADLFDEEDAASESSVSVSSAHEEITPVEPATSRPQHLVKPFPRESMLPKQTNSHFVQGVKFGLSGKYDEAIAELSRAVEEDPDHVIAHTSLGVAFHRLKEDGSALASYETALKLDPIYAEAHYFRANILSQRGSVREAIAGYTVAIGLQPELIEAHHKSRPQDRLTDYTDSPAEMYRIARPAHRILQLSQLLNSNPERANLFKERAAAYYRLRNYAQAIADYSAALAIQPRDASALHLRGVAYEQLGQSERALEDYQQAIAINPQLSNEYINRGVAFGQMGNFHQAIANLTEAIRLAPRNPDSYFNRGTVYIQQGDFERAIQDFSHVIRFSPADEEAYYWRGMSYEQTGRQREAIDDYRQFLALSRDEKAKAEIGQKLRQWNQAERNNPGTVRSLTSSRRGSASPGGQQQGVQDRRLSSRNEVQDYGKKADPLSSEDREEPPDLYVLIAALGERALHSTWFGNGVECFGEKAEELYTFTNQNRPIEGLDLLQITSGIYQTIKGDFQALDPGSTSPWIFIHAWEGSGFYIETNDPKITKQLRTYFQSLEEVEGANPPYQALFIPIETQE